MKGERPTLVFLLYMNRSGSTLLASLLDQYSEVGVTPEANIPDGLGGLKLRLDTPGAVEYYLDRLYEDRKFAAWNVERSSIRAALHRLPPPRDFGRILVEILKCYFTAPEVRTLVYKHGHYLFQVPRLRRLIPGCRFIFIERDIRGIFESQKRSIDSSSGRVMALNPLERALKYTRTMQLVSRYEHAPDFHVVKFENVIKYPDMELSRLVEFLGISGNKESSVPYFEKIPAAQRHLHEGIRRRPARDKIDSWKKVLSPVEINTIERVAGTTLRSRGYRLEKTAEQPVGALAFYVSQWCDLIFRHAPAEMTRKTLRRFSRPSLYNDSNRTP
jgi:hypothetical protein